MSNARSFQDLWAEWRDVWLASIADQIAEVHHRRQIHDELVEMLSAQDHPDRTFEDTFHLMYLESMVMAIRRQADNDNRTLSIRRLIGQLEHHQRAFTREAYVERWLDGFDLNSDIERQRLDATCRLQHAHDAFDSFTDEPGGEHLGGAWIQRQRADLRQLTRKVVGYADQQVAHVDRHAHDTVVTYEEFHRAIDHLGEMLMTFALLLEQDSWMTPTPVMQGDWKGPFRKPLAPPLPVGRRS